MARNTAMAAKAKSQDLAVASIEDELKEAAERVGSLTGGSKISLRGKRFTFPNDEALDSIEVVVIDVTNVNAYWAENFDSGNPTLPECYAIAVKQADLIPAADVPDKQHTACKGCPQNEWGSGNGNAKACKNMRRLAVVAPDSGEDGPIFTIDLPPTACKEWDKYFTNLAAKGKVPRQVITKFTMDPKVDYSRPVPHFVDSNEAFAVHHARLSEARTILSQGYDYGAYEERKPVRRTSSRVRSRK